MLDLQVTHCIVHSMSNDQLEIMGTPAHTVDLSGMVDMRDVEDELKVMGVYDDTGDDNRVSFDEFRQRTRLGASRLAFILNGLTAKGQLNRSEYEIKLSTHHNVSALSQALEVTRFAVEATLADYLPRVNRADEGDILVTPVFSKVKKVNPE